MATMCLFCAPFQRLLTSKPHATSGVESAWGVVGATFESKESVEEEEEEDEEEVEEGPAFDRVPRLRAM